MIVVAAAVLLCVGGVGASLVIKSPAQQAAEAGPPPMDVLVARVEKRKLTDSVIVRGTVTAGQSVQVAPVISSGEGGGAPVVTKVALKAGNSVTAGTVLMEVSGRPVFALKGKLPVYRDLKPGAKGEDVRQVQKALAQLGHGSGGDAAGRFGEGTKRALNSFYASLGYEPVPALADGGAGVKDAQDAVTASERALQDARDAAAEPSGTTGSAGKAGAEDAGAGSPKDGRRSVERAQEDLAEARAELSKAQAAQGPMLPTGEVVFLEDFPARVDSVPVRVGSPVNGPAMTLSAGALVVRGVLQEHQKGMVRAGQRVQILSEMSGTTAQAKVLSVSETLQQPERPAGDGEDAPPAGEAGYVMLVRPLKALPVAWAGQDVRLTIEAGATDGEALVVPVTAVSAGEDGRTTVTVARGEEQHRVEVRPGTTGDGYVEVVPLSDGELEEGDNVITGVNPGVAEKAGQGRTEDKGGAAE
ncbi:peptidoglycan-binding protein [Streptomyces sp. SID9727]|nr:peptidoglycan-binding protein [Streptomyces sp. SID9727]